MLLQMWQEMPKMRVVALGGQRQGWNPQKDLVFCSHSSAEHKNPGFYVQDNLPCVGAPCVGAKLLTQRNRMCTPGPMDSLELLSQRSEGPQARCLASAWVGPEPAFL